jgi:hypothetical protein
MNLERRRRLTEPMLTQSAIALAALVLVTTDPSYAQPLRSTSIPSSLADDEKRLLPSVMTEFYGPFEKETGYWIAKHEDSTFCIKPLRFDVRSSKLFIVAGGQLTRPPNEEDREQGKPVCDTPSGGSHADSGLLGLIVLTPNGANLGVVATNLHAPYGSWGRSPERDSVTFERLGPNGAYGWVAKDQDEHTGSEIEVSMVYGVIGDSVKLLTTIMSYWSNAGDGRGIRPDLSHWHRDYAERTSPLTAISADVVLEKRSSASSFYPIMLRVSGIYRGSPFRGSYRLVFDKSSLTYSFPKNMPDEIKPFAPRNEIKP